jgi:arabinose-5-phosphate isomerase
MLAKQILTPESSPSIANIEVVRRLHRARKVFQAEAAAVQSLSNLIDEDFSLAVQSIVHMTGSLIVTGIGKAGLIGQKIAATFASTGTPAHFVHPAEAMHGDLGRFQSSDVVLVLSNSGETEEVIKLLPALKATCAGLIAITAKPQSRLGKTADCVLAIPNTEEACSLNLAPTTSTTAMLAMGDALAMVVKDERGFAAQDFAANHPGGSLGLKLKRVEEVMRPLAECRVAHVTASIRNVIVGVAKPGRRTGAVMLIDDQEKLVGLFTDSDLARILERRQEAVLDQSIEQFMHRTCLSIAQGARLADAMAIIADRKISELPVLDDQQRPLGLIDITDLVAIFELNP